MSETAEELLDGVEENENEETPETSAAATARLCKGQMPSPLVWYIKFHELKDNKSAVAAKYFTTPGKITDIQTNANQKYIVEEMRFSDEELAEAIARIKENFVRGQAANEENPGSVGKRQLATTQAGDEEYALSVVEKVRELMEAVSDDAVTLADSRAAHNASKPKKEKATDEGEPEEEVAESSESEEEFEDDLLD